jgi:SAM-dependent methyltransferase
MTAADLYADGAALTASTLPAAAVVQADGRHLPYEDEFEAAGAFDVIEHVDDDRRVLEQLHRCLRAGGGLLLTVPQHRWLWGPSDELARHKRRYTRAELEAKVRAAGFSIVRCTSFVTLLLPLMAAVRLREKRGGADPMRPFHIARATNAALRGVMALEGALIRAGLTLPAGGSLLLVARKPAR